MKTTEEKVNEILGFSNGNIKKPKRNPNFPPNKYDLMVVSNGCGNKFTAETLNASVDGIMGPACTGHDWDWSEFCDKSEEQGNDDFYNKMQELIDSGDYNIFLDVLLQIQKQVFHGLVDTIGSGSYKEYNPFAIPPSLLWPKDCKMDGIECVNIKVLVSDNTYLLRWYTRQEAEEEGLIEYGFFIDD